MKAARTGRPTLAGSAVHQSVRPAWQPRGRKRERERERERDPTNGAQVLEQRVDERRGGGAAGLDVRAALAQVVLQHGVLPVVVVAAAALHAAQQLHGFAQVVQRVPRVLPHGRAQQRALERVRRVVQRAKERAVLAQDGRHARARTAVARQQSVRRGR
jgi:hypothetical protein